MIRSVQPTSALPVTRNMPYISASVPSRNQPRNMTGIYLGLEGNINPPANRGISGNRVRKGMSAKVRTPAEDRRYKMVELLRIKEEKRGFRGQPLRRREPREDEVYEDTVVSPRCQHSEQLQHRKWGPAKSANPHRFEDVIRQNPRNYTAINNNGVTRSENLTGLMSFAEQYGWDIASMPLPDALVEEVNRLANTREDLAGLEECFKKVCKSNVDSLHSLLPLRKGNNRPDSYSTGFTVRSYRNPNKAELLADFDVQPLTRGRPKTVPATSSQHQRQPLVPAPYFFKYYNKPGTAHSKKRNSPSSQFEDQNSSLNGDRILGGPGSGFISRSLKQGRNSAWSEGDVMKLRRGTPRNDSPAKDIDRQHHMLSSRHDNSPLLTNTQPLEIRAEGYHLNSDDKSLLSDRTGNTDVTAQNNQLSTERSSSDNKNKGVEKTDKIEVPSKVDEAESPSNTYDMDGRNREPADNAIRLDLETEDGKKQEIFLDDKELQKEETEKLKASEAKIASIQEDAKQRKKQLEQILDEHAEIVTTLVRQTSHDSSNETFQSAEGERDQ